MLPKPERHAEVVVDQPIDIVWNIITDSSKFHALKLSGVYSPFDREHAHSGMKFENKSIGTGETAPQYIVTWKSPSHFSFGNSPSNWEFEWRLSPNNGKTVVRFARRFDGSGLEGLVNWLEGLVEPHLSGDLQKLTDNTVASLKDACSRLASGEDDGLTHVPY